MSAKRSKPTSSLSTCDLWTIAHQLRSDAFTFVDLTHAFSPGQPKFAALPDQENSRLFTVDQDGFNVDRYSLVGQWGTHVDPPNSLRQ